MKIQTTNPKKLVNSKKNEQWAKLFLERVKKLTEGNEKEVKVVLGDVKRRRDKTYIVLRENLEHMLGYSDYLMVNSFGKPTTAARTVRILIHFDDFLRKPFKELKKSDIECFFDKYKYHSESYKSSIKRVIKPFFRWLYGNTVKDGYPEIVDWIYCGKKNNNKLPEILTMQEIQQMIEVCDNMRDRALVSVLYESGCRASEILDLKTSSINFDEYGAVLVVGGKTGSRRVRLVSSVPDLKAWLNVHPRKNETDTAVFVALTKNNKGNPLADSSLDFIISQIAKKAKIKKRVYPHLFRHTRATHLAKRLKESQLRILFGWSKTSDMPSVYVHLSGRDVEDAILQLNNIKPKNEEKPAVVPTLKCYRCNEVNSIGNKFCWKCGAPLQQESIERVKTVKNIVSEVTMYIFEKMKERKVGEEDLEGIVKEWVTEQNPEKIN